MQNKGFTAIEVLITLLLVSVLAFGGWYVWNERREGVQTNEAQQGEQQTETEAEDSLPENFTTYRNESLGLQFAYPEEWGEVLINQPTEDFAEFNFSDFQYEKASDPYVTALANKQADNFLEYCETKRQMNQLCSLYLTSTSVEGRIQQLKTGSYTSPKTREILMQTDDYLISAFYLAEGGEMILELMVSTQSNEFTNLAFQLPYISKHYEVIEGEYPPFAKDIGEYFTDEEINTFKNIGESVKAL